MRATTSEVGLAAAPEASVGWAGRIWRVVVFAWKYGVGVVFTQSLLGSLLIVGWTYRLMQRTTTKSWWKCSPQRSLHGTFASWARQNAGAAQQASWPNWLIRQNADLRQAWSAGGSARWKQFIVLPVHSLWANFRTGLQGAFNTAVLTLPGAALWWFSWYDGWNNSYHKGYEQAAVGPVLGVVGILLFIAAMLYVPMAQARQAATGNWRCFYQFGLVWGLVRRHWLAGLFLAGLYALCSLPVHAFNFGLIFAPIANPAIETFTETEALAYLNSHFLRAALLFFPLYALTKWVASKIYAHTILQGLQRGYIDVQQLGWEERQQLGALDLVQINPPRSRHVLARVAVGASSGVLRAVGLGLTALIWFAFVAQIYVAEFFKYNPVMGWLNQPLVLLPWYRYIPSRLQNQAEELVALALLLLAVGLVLWLARKLRPRVWPAVEA